MNSEYLRGVVVVYGHSYQNFEKRLIHNKRIEFVRRCDFHNISAIGPADASTPSRWNQVRQYILDNRLSAH